MTFVLLRKRIKWLLLGIFLFPSFVFSQQISKDEKGFPFGVFGLSSSKDAPIVIWFHGGMGSSKCDKGEIAGKGFSELASKAVVVSPSACKENHWVSESTIIRVDKILDFLEKQQKRGIKELNLVGVSDGALGVFIYSLYGKRKVNHRLLVSGFLKALGEPRDFAYAKKLQQGTWTFFQGKRDRLYPSELTFPWNQEFCLKRKNKCEILEDNLGEHDWSYWEKNQKEMIFKFIEKL